jgi:pyrrolidone-carboxylate peptidase
MKLLVTGFGPFPGVHHNPSGQIALAIGRSARLKRQGVQVSAHELIVTYAALPDLAALIASEKPDAILMFGIAARTKQPRLEKRGENRTRPLSVDASGTRPKSRKLDDYAPLIRNVRVPLEPLRLAIDKGSSRRSRTMPALISAMRCCSPRWASVHRLQRFLCMFPNCLATAFAAWRKLVKNWAPCYWRKPVAHNSAQPRR